MSETQNDYVGPRQGQTQGLSLPDFTIRFLRTSISWDSTLTPAFSKHVRRLDLLLY
jgi:hypothetical protein